MNTTNDWNFSERAARLQRSAVREFVKLTARPGLISFAGGLPASELFPVAEMARATARVFDRFGPRLLQYSETEGVSELREWLARRFSNPSFEVRPEHVLITSGAQQALHLLGLILLDEGDVVLAENPTYLALLSAWRTFGARFLALPADAQGISPAGLETLPALPGRPKAVYVQPNFQNPQGITLPASRRTALVEWVQRNRRLWLVEDNAYGDLRYEGDALPHLLHLASGGQGGLATPDDAHIAHVGTFSKIIAPGLRIGWVIGPATLIDKLTQAKQAADLHTSTVNQCLVVDLLQDGFLDRHLPILREGYRTRRDTMLAALMRHFPEAIVKTAPQGGFFLMLHLPSRPPARDLLRHALARGVAFVPGDEFYLDGTGSQALRLNFSNATPQNIQEGIARLRQAWEDSEAPCKKV